MSPVFVVLVGVSNRVKVSPAYIDTSAPKLGLVLCSYLKMPFRPVYGSHET